MKVWNPKVVITKLSRRKYTPQERVKADFDLTTDEIHHFNISTSCWNRLLFANPQYVYWNNLIFHYHHVVIRRRSHNYLRYFFQVWRFLNEQSNIRHQFPDRNGLICCIHKNKILVGHSFLLIFNNQFQFWSMTDLSWIAVILLWITAILGE